MNAKRSQLGFRVAAESDGDSNVADHIFENQVPADDPGKNFAKGCVRIRVRAASDGNHGRKFGVAETSKAARNGNENERNCDGRPGGRTSVHESPRGRTCPQEIDDQIENLRVQNRWSFKVLAGRGGSGEDENSRADDGTDPKRGERPRAQGFLE